MIKYSEKQCFLNDNRKYKVVTFQHTVVINPSLFYVFRLFTNQLMTTKYIPNRKWE